MNIGEGQTAETSGEKIVFKILNNIPDKKEVVVFDVGAHTGEWFNLLKKNYQKKSKVYCFEPSKIAYETLSKIKADGFHPLNLALGDTSGIKYLSAETEGSTMAYVSDKKDSGNFSEKISLITLDEYCYENKIQNIDLLKLDVEGYELKVLYGAKEMIKDGNIQLIQFEFGAPSSEKYSLKDFFDLLDRQYKICRILKWGYYPLSKYHHYYEINTLTNFIAIKR
jgi:FkbM family methyltransferase